MVMPTPFYEGLRHSPQELRGRTVAKQLLIKKINVMNTIFNLLKRKRRKWVSYYFHGCLYDRVVIVVMRCPVIDGIPVIHLSWQHKVTVE